MVSREYDVFVRMQARRLPNAYILSIFCDDQMFRFNAHYQDWLNWPLFSSDAEFVSANQTRTSSNKTPLSGMCRLNDVCALVPYQCQVQDAGQTKACD